SDRPEAQREIIRIFNETSHDVELLAGRYRSRFCCEALFVQSRAPQRSILNEAYSPLGSITVSSTCATRDHCGPAARSFLNSSTSGARPSAITSTVPSGQLRT